MTLEQLAGLYECVTAAFAPVDGGGAVYPYGPDAWGCLLYRPDGFMSLHLMAAGRPRFAQFDLLGGTPEENHVAFRTAVSFCGRYHLEGEEVWYDIEISSVPNFVGPRAHHSHAELRGETLFLTGRPFALEGRTVQARFEWKRIADG